MDPYYDAKYLRYLTQKYGVKMSKGMGQNFLTDEGVAEKIVELSGIGEDDCVVEIGPGASALTRKLSVRAKKIVAVEVDKNLIPLLNEALAGIRNVKVINADALKIDIDALIDEEFDGRSARLCANLPYNVATAIITRVLEKSKKTTDLTVMVQREVAKRICASPGSKQYGALTLICEYYSHREELFDVLPASFTPPPKVVSTVMSLKRRESPPVKSDISKLMKVINASFSQRRKTLQNSLCAGMGEYKKDMVRDVLIEMGKPEDIRAEMLSLHDFDELYTALESQEA